MAWRQERLQEEAAMSFETIAVIAPGDMGHAVGRVLGEYGHRVVTALDGRSATSRARAATAGMIDLGTLDTVLAEADLVLSILPPAEAAGFAKSVAAAMQRTGRRPVFADCNAVAPATVEAIAATIAAAGAGFVDAGIVGPPPGQGTPPRFYASGPDAAAFATLDGKGIVVRVVGDAPGRASAVKMCYAALNKGRHALNTAVLLAAENLGVRDVLTEELAASQAAALRQMESAVPWLVGKAGRWAGEMDEIAATFAAAHVTPHFHQGAGDIYRLLAGTELAAETRESADRCRTLDAAISVFAQATHAGST
jgi:3-hydroxyisobutyrate dehydrogenase-like beta-hydroxyacid dehydrogenase